MNLTKKSEIILVTGDFGAKIGEEAQNECSEALSLGVRSECRNPFAQFCEEHHLAITNTLFKHHPRRLPLYLHILADH